MPKITDPQLRQIFHLRHSRHFISGIFPLAAFAAFLPSRSPVPDVTGPAPIPFAAGGDTGDPSGGSAQQEGQRAKVINVAADVRIEVD
ncbi:MAG: hypothetical protein JO015_16740 [Verrucomicrobia bacterium]|nr:hypothetical protein [Verrucomicrobiota bacterium]